MADIDMNLLSDAINRCSEARKLANSSYEIAMEKQLFTATRSLSRDVAMYDLMLKILIEKEGELQGG